MKICPKAYKMCQSEFKTLPKTKFTLNKLPKIFNLYICQSDEISRNLVTLPLNGELDA